MKRYTKKLFVHNDFSNFVHFTSVTILLGKAAITFGVIQLATSAAVFGVFATWFGLVLYRTPKLEN